MMWRAATAVLSLFALNAYAACGLFCWTVPTLWKGEPSHDYPCANGTFQFQPLYIERGEGNNVTLTASPLNGGTLSNIQNAPGVAITWTHNGNDWTGHPQNFSKTVGSEYGFALTASGVNCTVRVYAQ